MVLFYGKLHMGSGKVYNYFEGRFVIFSAPIQEIRYFLGSLFIFINL